MRDHHIVVFAITAPFLATALLALCFHKQVIEAYSRSISYYYCAQGEQLCKAGKNDEAIIELSKAIDIAPEDSRALVYRAYVYAITNRYKLAIVDYTAALKLTPLDSVTYCSRANEYFSLGDYKKAIEDYDTAIRLNPKNTEYFVWRGMAKQDMKQGNAAISDLDKALEISPRNLLAHEKKTWIYHEQKKLDLALKEINETLKIDPQNTFVLNQQTRIYLEQNQLEKAWKSAQALLAKGDDADNFDSLGDIYTEKKEYRKALQCYDKALKIDPKHHAHYGRIDALAQLERYNDVINDCTKKITEDRTTAWYYCRRSTAYRHLKSYSHSIEDCMMVIKLNPKDTDPYENLRLIYSAQGDLKRAKQYADKEKALEKANAKESDD